MNPNFIALEFYKIIEKLKEHALSDRARQALDGLFPYTDEDICRHKMAQTTAARAILDGCGNPPLVPMKELDETLLLAQAGAMLSPSQLIGAAQFSVACRRLAAYLKRGESIGADIAVYGRGIEDLSELQKRIEGSVNEDGVLDEADASLRDVRRKKERTEAQIKEKLNHILQSRKQYLADSYISKRNGHYVVPVLRRYQNQFGGTVIEVSGKGTTVFMEPNSVANLQAELTALEVEEDCEIRRILYTLTAFVEQCSDTIKRNMDAMEKLDIVFAKAKLSAAMKARAVEIGGERRIKIIGGCHPLLNRESCVPLNFSIDGDTLGVIITGPNTGGKTVAIKTVGLLSLMAQCGLHIPCELGSYIAMQDNFLCDIGDNQSMEQNLSTFSGHITNVIDILKNVNSDSLVLLDELGSGTDPAEGMGIAIAVLEELKKRGCMFLVTTHYPQVKTYAESTCGILSARMAFDKETLRPLYRLEMGKSGESCALCIAERLGLPKCLLRRAHCEVYGGEVEKDTKPAFKAPKSRLTRAVLQKSENLSLKFSMGDSVIVPSGETGIVYRVADENGDVVVQVKGEKLLFKHNRIKLRVAAAELYPPDYDFSIIFDTVENRKARRIVSKRYDADAEVVYEQEEFRRGDR